MKNIKNNQGFSLIEMVLYISISMIIMVGATYFYLSLVSNTVKSEVAQKVQTQTYGIIEQIQNDLFEATNISTPSQGSSNNLVLETPNGDILYSLTNGKVFRQVGSLAPEELNDYEVWINSITFINSADEQNPDSLTVSIASNGSSTNLRNEFHYNYQAQTTITLRQ